MPELLTAHLENIAAKIRSAPQVLLFTDFDGTLVPIKEQPTECFLALEVRETLIAIAAQDQVEVGIISGRALADLQPRVGIEGIAYAGNHGLEIAGDGFTFREPQAVSSIGLLDNLVQEVTQAIAKIPGAWVQHKGLSASVHYRQVEPAAIPLAIAAVRQVVAPAIAAQQFVLRSGKAVLEIRPAVDWHKGKAVQWLAHRMSSQDQEPLLIYLGDDNTDEDAFAACPEGITVCIGGKRDTLANYSAQDPKEVHTFLDWLKKHL